MKKPLSSIAAAAAVALLIAASGAHAARIEVNGDITHSVEQRYSPTSAFAIGPGATAEALVNNIDGNVRVQGSLRQTAKQSYSPVTAFAMGPGASAKARVNSVSGR